MSKEIKICIDAGHGMSNRTPGKYDAGASSGGAEEASIALDWALTLKHVLTQAGIKVFLTRGDRNDPNPVGQRAKEATANGCTHFISLHCNASGKGASGTETFYRDNADKVLAAGVQKAAMLAMKSKDRGLKTEASSQHKSLAIFGFNGPTCLLEIGFIDHAGDRSKMLLRETRLAFANELLKYFQGL